MTFKIIIIKFNNFIIHDELWLNDVIKLLVYNYFFSSFIGVKFWLDKRTPSYKVKEEHKLYQEFIIK